MRKPQIITILFSFLILISQVGAQDSSTSDTRTRKLREIDAELRNIDQQFIELNSRKQDLQKQRALLSIAEGQAQGDQFSNIRFPVIRVGSEETVILIINGHQQEVRLSGISVKLGQSQEAVSLLNRELAAGSVYARCLNEKCTEALLYVERDGPSLNCKLLESELAFLWGTPLNCADDSVSQIPLQGLESQEDVEMSGPSSNPPPGTEVKVKGYYRKDGTYVRPHTRSAPRRRN